MYLLSLSLIVLSALAILAAGASFWLVTRQQPIPRAWYWYFGIAWAVIAGAITWCLLKAVVAESGGSSTYEVVSMVVITAIAAVVCGGGAVWQVISNRRFLQRHLDKHTKKSVRE